MVYVDNVNYAAMGKKRNLTIQLDEETIDKARVIAAERGTSVSGLVRQQLSELVEQRDSYERSKRIALQYLRRGFHLGGKRVPREELHDRKALREESNGRKNLR